MGIRDGMHLFERHSANGGGINVSRRKRFDFNS
jgi:hypothetical protein